MFTSILVGGSLLTTGVLLGPAAYADESTDAALQAAADAAVTDPPAADAGEHSAAYTAARADYWAARAAYQAKRDARAARRAGLPVPETAVAVAEVAPASASGGGGQPAPTGGDLVPSDDALAALRQCESGGDYGINTGNGYYGAYQFAPTTWWGIGYQGYPHEASPATQDAAVRTLFASSGWAPWPSCARQLGFL